MTATNAVTKWTEEHKSQARVNADEASKDETAEINEQLTSIEEEYETKSQEMRAEGKRYLQISADLAPLNERLESLTDQLKGVAPSEEDINALAVASMMQDLSRLFATDSAYHLHLVIPAKPAEGSVMGEILCDVIDAPRVKTTGKSFLRITGTEHQFVGSFRDCVTQLYESHRPSLMRYFTRGKAAEEDKISEKTGKQNLVQKMSARAKVSLMISDLFDPRLCIVPYGQANVIECGRTRPDGKESIELTAKLVMAKDAPEGIRTNTPEAVAFVHVEQNDKANSQAWRPIGIGGTPSEDWDEELQKAYAGGTQIHRALAAKFVEMQSPEESQEETHAEPEAVAVD